MTEPYEGAEDGYSGYPVYTDEQVKGFMREAAQDRMQILVHCNGDAAAQQMIDAYRETRRKDVDIRPVMIHAQLVREDQLEEMKQIGILPSFFIAHIYYWGEVHRKNFGEKRASSISPAKAAAGLEIAYTFHQDTPVVQPNMMETLWCAVNRISKEGNVLGAGQRLTPFEALKGITVNAAYQYFEEAEKGTLECGKKADFTVLDRNPLKVSAEQLRDISVSAVIKDGKLMYSKK